MESSDLPTQRTGLFNRLTQGLSKTRQKLFSGLSNLVFGKKTLDASIFDAIEALLLEADLGLKVTQPLIQNLTEQMKRSELSNSEQVWHQLKQHLIAILQPYESPHPIQDSDTKPFVILMVGVNGVGKTTTLGKLCYYLQRQKKKVLLAAGDTFRAAATEQLQVWSERVQAPLIAQHQGADSASVLYDALKSAKAKNYDVLIADTAGRLHTSSPLLRELEKIIRVLKKIDETAPHEVMLILDATMGQNALNQALQFKESVPVSSITLTKLDGSSKGGILFSIAQTLGLPIRFIGVGERMEDLQPFNAVEFVEALLGDAAQG